MGKLGYCCINLSINEGRKNKDKISVNRGMTKKTFLSKGLSYVSELTIRNLEDLQKILEWNVDNSIFLYRMSSDMFPCIGFYKIEDLPNFDYICEKLENIGKFIKNNSIRVSFHPSHFCILGSEREEVINNTIDELDKHAQIMDLMGLDKTDYYPINIHLNTTKPTREEAAKRFCSQFQRLADSTKRRLTIENDDGKNQYSVKMLWELVHKKIGIPIVFDQHHFKYGPQDSSMEEALHLSHSTWKTIPLTHMSSSRKIEDNESVETAHSDFIWEKIENFGLDFDTELECKMKEKALLKYRFENHIDKNVNMV